MQNEEKRINKERQKKYKEELEKQAKERVEYMNGLKFKRNDQDIFGKESDIHIRNFSEIQKEVNKELRRELYEHEADNYMRKKIGEEERAEYLRHLNFMKENDKKIKEAEQIRKQQEASRIQKAFAEKIQERRQKSVSERENDQRNLYIEKGSWPNVSISHEQMKNYIDKREQAEKQKINCYNSRIYQSYLEEQNSLQTKLMKSFEERTRKEKFQADLEKERKTKVLT